MPGLGMARVSLGGCGGALFGGSPGNADGFGLYEGAAFECEGAREGTRGGSAGESERYGWGFQDRGELERAALEGAPYLNRDRRSASLVELESPRSDSAA